MKTNRHHGGLALLALTGILASTTARAQETQEAELAKESGSPISTTLSVDVLSDYMWRGRICNGNPVWQPDVILGYDTGDYGAFNLDIWSSFDLTHKRGTLTNNRRDAACQEVDFMINYAVEFYGVGLEVGHIWYVFPNGSGPSDQDLYVTVSYANDFVTPSASLYWNYSDSAWTDVSQIYATFGLSHDFALTDALTLTPSASLGFGDNAWTKYAVGEAVGTELTDQTVGLSASYAINDHVSVGAQVNYTWIPSHELRKYDYMGAGKDQLLWGGVNLTISF